MTHIAPIASITFTSPINIEYSTSAHSAQLGQHESTMALFASDEEGYYSIEWDIPVLEDTVYIGIWADEYKIVCDYDGVFQLPKEAVRLLRANGFTITKEFE